MQESIRSRSLAILARLEHFYGRRDAIKWFDWKRAEFGGMSAREAIACGKIADIEDYVARLGRRETAI